MNLRKCFLALSIFLSIFILTEAQAQTSTSGRTGMTTQEEDGTPDLFCRSYKFSNDSLTDNGDGSCSISTGGGGGGISAGALDVDNADSTVVSGAGTMNFPTAGNLVASTGGTSGTADVSLIDNPTIASTLTITGSVLANDSVTVANSVVITGMAADSTDECVQVTSNGTLQKTGSACGGAGGSPGGSDTQFQYNDGGSFGGIASVIWNDSAMVLTDEQVLAFGTDSDWKLYYDEDVDNQLLLTTTNTATNGIDEAMITILVPTGTTNGQEIFRVATGSQATPNDLFSVDENGDVTIDRALYITDGVTNFVVCTDSNGCETDRGVRTNIAQGTAASYDSSFGTTTAVDAIYVDASADRVLISDLVAFKLPSSTSVVVDANGEVAIDTDTDGDLIDQGTIVYHDGTQKMYVIATDDITGYVDGDVVAYDATADKWVVEAQSGGGGTDVSGTSVLTLGTTTGFDNERVFTAGAGLSASDGGAGSTYTLSATVTPSSANTLTNKTMDSDNNTFSNIAVSETKLVAGTNITLSTDTLNVDDAFLINSGSDTMTGTLTADGLTLGANENITLGSNTLDHDGTTFVFNDDVTVSDEVYGAGWNASLEVPTKNAVYDKIETISAGGGDVTVSGTPVANQVTYWTSDSTIAGDAGMTYTSASDKLTVAGTIETNSINGIADTIDMITTADTVVSFTGGGSFTGMSMQANSADPCGGLPSTANTMSLFASTGGFFCFCDTTGADKLTHDITTDCTY